MKKKYSKPDIMFESFTLSNNIASTCAPGTESLHDTMISACGKLFSDGSMVFTTNVSGCSIQVTPDEYGDAEWGEYCYHVPANLLNAFDSG